MAQRTFTRKILTPALLVRDLGHLLWHLPSLLGALRDPRIPAVFREKLMTVVTAVNGCAFCAWFHARLALASGMSEQEVRQLLDLQFQADPSADETPGLLYAQHFAETDRAPDPQLAEQLQSHYGPRSAQHIRVLTRAITFSNLAGNTFDAFLSRLRGASAPQSSLLFELLFFLVVAPFYLPLLPLVKKYRAD